MYSKRCNKINNSINQSINQLNHDHKKNKNICCIATDIVGYSRDYASFFSINFYYKKYIYANKV